MNASELRAKVWQEIQQVPEEKLAELYDLISGFRVGVATRNHNRLRPQSSRF